MVIRAERMEDYAGIREVNVAAFANHPFSKQTEHLIVEALRVAGALSVSLVAELEGRVVGHTAFSKAKIDGKECGWFMLGPVAVLPDFQRHGIGVALVKEGLAAIQKLGATGCVLVGDPKYYCRCGFVQNPALTMKGVPAEVILSLPITDKKARGEVTHHPAFWVTA
jgi:putative acetyltransferase